jgi:hypothetical protein
MPVYMMHMIFSIEVRLLATFVSIVMLCSVLDEPHLLPFHFSLPLTVSENNVPYCFRFVNAYYANTFISHPVLSDRSIHKD